jgi:hypothetical protein
MGVRLSHIKRQGLGPQPCDAASRMALPSLSRLGMNTAEESSTRPCPLRLTTEHASRSCAGSRRRAGDAAPSDETGRPPRLGRRRMPKPQAPTLGVCRRAVEVVDHRSPSTGPDPELRQPLTFRPALWASTSCPNVDLDSRSE